jgi:hypothetical protein
VEPSRIAEKSNLITLLKCVAALTWYALGTAAASAHDPGNTSDPLPASFVIAPAFSPTPFRLLDWMTDNGSGGFPEGFDDENRRLYNWDQSPDQQQIQ